MKTSEVMKSAITGMKGGQLRKSEIQREDDGIGAVSEGGQRPPQISSSLILPTSLISSSSSSSSSPVLPAAASAASLVANLCTYSGISPLDQETHVQVRFAHP